MITLKNSSLIILSCLFLLSQICNAQTDEISKTQSRFDELMHLIRTGNAYQRAKAIHPFANTGDSRVVPVLKDLLDDEDSGVRYSAAHQLAWLADKRSTDALVNALSDTNSHVRRYAAQGLAKIGNEQHVPALVKAVMDHLPHPKTTGHESRYSASALDAISKLSSKAPVPIVKLLDRISDKEILEGGDWWWLLENIANCLGHIGDKTAYKPLRKARISLEKNYQDYKTWYAVRKALAAINPEDMTFDRPAADILAMVRTFKITEDGIRQKWTLPLAELDQKAVEDLSWAVNFTSERDSERLRVALDALGEIGGTSARIVLRQFIEKQSSLPEKGRRNYFITRALLALIKAEPTEKTAKEVVLNLQLLERFRQERLIHDISEIPREKIPAQIKVAFCKYALFDSNRPKSLEKNITDKIIWMLEQTGGQQAGDVLGNVLLNPSDIKTARAAAKALGTIKDYDAIPTLLRVSILPNAPIDAIAQAMGTIEDPQAIPFLRDMARSDRLTVQGRLWIAAALARLEQDYEQNSGIIRQALPDSMIQAAWLSDVLTVRAVAEYAHQPAGEYGWQSIKTLESIGTPEALQALITITEEKPLDSPLLRELSATTARLAGKLKHPTEKHWADIATVTEAVPKWFVIPQRVQPLPQRRSSFQAVQKNPALARKIWIAEANRRLDLAAKPNIEDYMSNIPQRALAIENIFAPELMPVLERIVKESKDKVSFSGKYKRADFYIVRSRAAKILTEKTGKQYTFVDIDGRTHPGGWDPSQ